MLWIVVSALLLALVAAFILSKDDDEGPRGLGGPQGSRHESGMAPGGMPQGGPGGGEMGGPQGGPGGGQPGGMPAPGGRPGGN